MQSADKLPLTVAIAQLRSTYSQEYGLQMAGVVVATLPLVVLFLVTQGALLSGIVATQSKE
jgi:ABC-type glycerol-3-phosphate transport system permease component